MPVKNTPDLVISQGLLEAIRTFPLRREVEHCGARVTASPFALYVDCPRCGAHVKVRGFSAGAEVEDVFDAVFEWLNQPLAQELARERQKAIAEDAGE